MRTDSVASVTDLDRRFLFHPFTVLGRHEREGPRIFVEGSGCELVDPDGARYIDAMAGLWCVNVGYGRAEIAQTLHDQASRLSYYHAFSSMGTEGPAMLAERLIGVAPANMAKVFFGSSGSDANDTQLKLTWFYNNALGRPEKKKIISRRRGYHGVTIASASLTGLSNLHDGFDLPLPMIRHTTPPYRLFEAEPGMTDAEFVEMLASDLETLIIQEGPDTVAAFIAEPVMAAGGVIVPPDGYFARIQEVLAKYDVLLIADEVVTAFGRLGSWFASDVYGLEPDLITVAKGITSAYVPLSACLVSEKVWRVLVDGAGTAAFGHGYTYSCHPLATAAAMTNLDILDREGLPARASEVGAYMQEQLRDAFDGHPLVGEVRGRDLIAAVEFLDEREPAKRFDPALQVGARVARACLDRGVITRALPAADTIALSPPFVISEAEIDQVVIAARGAADEVVRDLGR